MRYDVRFDAIAPATANDAAQQDVIRLIINVEATDRIRIRDIR